MAERGKGGMGRKRNINTVNGHEQREEADKGRGEKVRKGGNRVRERWGKKV